MGEPVEHIERHRDGTLWARGQKRDGVAVGYWEWFRKNGVRMRSGWFDDKGEQTGEWITYDQDGKVYKRTLIAPVVRTRL